MSNEQLIIDLLRSIPLRFAATDQAINVVRGEVQHLSRRLDNLLATSAHLQYRPKADAENVADSLRALTDRLGQIESRLSAASAKPARKAPARKAAKKSAPKRAPAKVAKKAAPKRAVKSARKTAKRPASKGRR